MGSHCAMAQSIYGWLLKRNTQEEVALFPVTEYLERFGPRLTDDELASFDSPDARRTPR